MRTGIALTNRTNAPLRAPPRYTALTRSLIAPPVAQVTIQRVTDVLNTDRCDLPASHPPHLITLPRASMAFIPSESLYQLPHQWLTDAPTLSLSTDSFWKVLSPEGNAGLLAYPPPRSPVPAASVLGSAASTAECAPAAPAPASPTIPPVVEEAEEDVNLTKVCSTFIPAHPHTFTPHTFIPKPPPFHMLPPSHPHLHNQTQPLNLPYPNPHPTICSHPHTTHAITMLRLL